MGQPTPHHTQTYSLASINADMGALITIITHYPRTSEFKIVSVSCWGHPACDILEARASLLSAAGALHSAQMGACCSLWMLWNACCRAEVFSCPQSPELRLKHVLQLFSYLEKKSFCMSGRRQKNKRNILRNKHPGNEYSCKFLLLERKTWEKKYKLSYAPKLAVLFCHPPFPLLSKQQRRLHVNSTLQRASITNNLPLWNLCEVHPIGEEKTTGFLEVWISMPCSWLLFYFQGLYRDAE